VAKKQPSTSERWSAVTDEEPRSRVARAAAERALVRIVHHYGETPGFVLIGGLVPELLCSGSRRRHAGTTDIDVQVDLEIAAGAVNTKRLETALKNAEFEPDTERVWRWKADGPSSGAVVKFELLADLDTEPNQSTINFNECEHLGAANLRGTGIATHDTFRHPISAKVGDKWIEVDVEVTGLGGFLLAKVAAAHSRRKTKDWYDIAFVLLENDAGGPTAAASAVVELIDSDARPHQTALDDLRSNFADADAQGSRAFAEQMLVDHPDSNIATLRADALLAVRSFLDQVERRA
jgi:hypothetical protein